MVHGLSKRFSLGFTAAAACLFALTPLHVSAATPPAAAAILQVDPEHSCAGEPATLTWTEPGDSTGLTGYRIIHSLVTPAGFTSSTRDLTRDETSYPFTIPFGLSAFSIFAITASGVAPEPFAAASVMGNQAPRPMGWDLGGTNRVGNGTATVSYRWFGLVTTLTTGGTLPVTVRVTASPGGDTIESPADSLHVTSTFTGLTNGVDYTFEAVAFNACGASAESASPTFTPGVAPEWTRATPPLTAGRGQYVYNFTATGDPAPTYELVDAPSWLQISSKGLVSGRPPAGSGSFSYSVVARNGVGIHPFGGTDALAGPFTVTVRAP